MINKVILVGNVGKDPEINNLQGDTKVAKFSFATNKSYKDKSGEKKTETQWHNISCWNSLAGLVDQYVKKGMVLYLEGEIAYRSYEKDGQTKYFTEIVANNIKFLSKSNNQETSNSSAQDGITEIASADDDLPF